MTELSVDLLDPPAYSPAYDHELAAALGRAGARVRLLTSAFAFADVPSPSGYAREERFYRHAVGGAGSRLRALSKRAQHVPNLLSYKDPAAVVHWQWTRGLDLALGPERPTVVTVHDPHGAAGLGRADAIIVHTEHAREQLAGFDNVHVVPHGALALTPARPRFHSRPMVLCFGLIRPYKGIDTLLAAWRQVHGADLWIVGRQLTKLPPLPPHSRLVSRYVGPEEQAELFATADIAVLPYQRSERFGFSGVLATALGAAKPTIVSDLPGFKEVITSGAVAAVPPDDPDALAGALQNLIDDQRARARLAAAAADAAATTYSWSRVAEATLSVYRSLL